MKMLLKATLFLTLAALTAAQSAGRNLGPTYTLQTFINLTVTNYEDRQEFNFSRNASSTMASFSRQIYFEWESYDGWFNNPAHPEWGGAGK